jgi:regulator of RNase E activity RraA
MAAFVIPRRSPPWTSQPITNGRRPPPNLTLHQAFDINVPIGCGDAPVFPGDVLVGDADGVIVVPQEIANEIAKEAVEMTAFEDFVAERVRSGQPTIGLYPLTEETNLEAFAVWRKERRR